MRSHCLIRDGELISTVDVAMVGPLDPAMRCDAGAKPGHGPLHVVLNTGAFQAEDVGNLLQRIAVAVHQHDSDTLLRAELP